MGQISGLVAEHAVAALAGRVRGDQVCADGKGFESAVAPWNGAIAVRPAVVLRCERVEDVVAGIEVARGLGMPLAVRGRGHDWAGRSLRDGGLTLDLGGLTAVRVDPARQQVTVGGGTGIGELLTAAGEHGLVAVTGTVDSVGVVGLATGGGYGPLGGRFGMAADNLVAATVVLADGSVVIADENHEPDLLWALRGGGGNFGVVVEARFDLHRVPSVVGGTAIYPLDQAVRVLTNLQERHETMPDELTVQTALLSGPDGVPIVLVSSTWCGSAEVGLAEDGPVHALGRLGTPVMATVAEKDLAADAAGMGAMFPYGRNVEIRTRFAPVLTEGIAGLLAEYVARRPSPLSAVAVHSFHGAAARVAPETTAFGTRMPHHQIEVISIWTGEEDSAANRRWAADLGAELAPHAMRGGYANLLGPDAIEQIPFSFGDNGGRLREVKGRYDPLGVFDAIPLP